MASNSRESQLVSDFSQLKVVIVEIIRKNRINL